MCDEKISVAVNSEDEPTRELTAGEEARLLAALELPGGPRGTADLRPFVCLILATGLRLGEACILRWEDVDWSARSLTVHQVKTGQARHVPLSGGALAILRALGPGAGHIFRREDGAPLPPALAARAVRKAGRRAGFSGLRAHDLRHGAAQRRPGTLRRRPRRAAA